MARRLRPTRRIWMPTSRHCWSERSPERTVLRRSAGSTSRKGTAARRRDPSGSMTFEDKVLQRGVAMLLEPIYEQEFYDYWARSRKGRWVPKRKTASKRFSRSLRAVNQEMRRVRHRPIGEQSQILGRKLRVFYGDYGVRGNSRSLAAFLHESRARWKKWLSRRSHKAWVTWEAFDRMARRTPLPRPRMRSWQPRLANL